MATRAANAIRVRRVSLGLTQAELAERAQVSESSIYMWENGNRFPYTMDIMRRLAKALQCTTEELFNEIYRLCDRKKEEEEGQA